MHSTAPTLWRAGHPSATGGTQWCMALGTTWVQLGWEPLWRGQPTAGALWESLLTGGRHQGMASANRRAPWEVLSLPCHLCARPCARRCPAGRGGPWEPPRAGPGAGGRAGGARGEHGAGTAGGAAPSTGAPEPAGDARSCPGTGWEQHCDTAPAWPGQQRSAPGPGQGWPTFGVLHNRWCCPDPAHGAGRELLPLAAIASLIPPVPLIPPAPWFPLPHSFPVLPSFPCPLIPTAPGVLAQLHDLDPLQEPCMVSPGHSLPLTRAQRLEGGCQPHLQPKSSPVLQRDAAGMDPGPALAPQVSWGWRKCCRVALLSSCPPNSPPGPGDTAGGGTLSR